MAETAQNTGTTPLEPMGILDYWGRIDQELKDLKRLAAGMVIVIGSVEDCLGAAWDYADNAPLDCEIKRKIDAAVFSHEEALTALGEQVSAARAAIEKAQEEMDACAPLIDDLRDFEANATAWQSLYQAREALSVGGRPGRAASVIEKIDEAIKQLKHNASIVFLHT